MTRFPPWIPRPLDVFVIARSLSYLADAMKAFIIPVLVFELTGSAAMSGIALAVEYVPKIVLVPFIGAGSQRFRLRPQFLVADGARAALCAVLALALPVDIIMVVAALIAVSGSYAYLLNESLVAAVFVDRERTVAQARLQATDQLARVAGPALGAGLYMYLDSRWIVGIATALFVLGGLALFCLPKTVDRPASMGNRGAHGGARRGLAILLRSPVLIRLTFLLFATNFAGGVFLAVAPALIAETFRLPLSHFGIVASVASAVSAGLMWSIGRRAPAGGATATLGRRSLLAAVVAMAITTAAPNFIVFVVGYSVFTAANICFATYQRIERLRFMPANAVGETIGLMTALFWLSVPLSGAIVAALTGPAGLQLTMLAASVATTACVLWLQRGLPKGGNAAAADYPALSTAATPRNS